MTSKFFLYLLSGLGILVCLRPINASADAALRPGCYAIVDPKEAATEDNAQEILCVDASGHAVVRESSIFGEGVKGCNVVGVASRDGLLVVDIDYRRCTNNTPSHQLTCHPDKEAGAFACMNKLTSEKSDDLPVRLAPLH